jgi:hypothetical protein
MPGVFDLLVAPQVHWLWCRDIGDEAVPSENLGLLISWITALCAVKPFAVFGGRIGGRPRGESTSVSTCRTRHLEAVMNPTPASNGV